MKTILFSVLLMISAMEIVAQQYFVFIQEASGQPFYVRIKEESHSSSASGHIILPQLRDSVYQFFIGFPRGRYGEQLFIIPINRKDHGYELRNSGGRHHLFDLQTQQAINPVSTEQVSDQTIKQTDTYSELMAGVVDDTAVLYTSAADTMAVDSNAVVLRTGVDSGQVVIPDSIKARTAGKGAKGKAKNKAAAKKDTAQKVVVQTEQSPVADTGGIVPGKNEVADTSRRDTANIEVVDTTAALAEGNKVRASRDSRDIIRLITENVREGKLMIYVDRTGAVNDTIRIIIPRRL